MRAVSVDDHSGKTVGFAPNKPTKGGIQIKAAPEVAGQPDAATEKILVERLAAAGKSPGHNLAQGVVNGRSERTVLVILEGNDLPWLGITENFLNFAGIDPIVAVKDAGAGFDDDSGHGWRGSKWVNLVEEVAGTADFA